MTEGLGRVWHANEQRALVNYSVDLTPNRQIKGTLEIEEGSLLKLPEEPSSQPLDLHLECGCILN
jgi:hypothetical protein